MTLPRIRLHEDCRICDVVKNPLPHDPEPRMSTWHGTSARTGKVPAQVALYCDQTGQDVPHPHEAS